MDLLAQPRALSRALRFVPYGVDQYCPVMASAALARGQLRRTELLGAEVVVLRALDGRVRAFEDRCPHRGVALSQGEVCGDGVQCGYHGWKLDGSGRVCAIPGLAAVEGGASARAYAAIEAGGLIWLFVGDARRAPEVPPPDLAPYGSGRSADLWLSLEVAAHWSFVLDNGLDLFHQHLHRDVPFFFEVHELLDFGPASGEHRFHVRYGASLRDALNRRRRGEIRLCLDGNRMALDFDGFPLIHAVATPRSADGRRLTLFWMIAFPASALGQLALRLWMPVLRRQLLRGFRQDVRVLESEQRAFSRDPRAPQLEVNPVIHAAHEHLLRLISKNALAAVDADRGGIRPEALPRASLLERAARGELSLLSMREKEGELRLVEPEHVADALPAVSSVSVWRYQHFCVVRP